MKPTKIGPLEIKFFEGNDLSSGIQLDIIKGKGILFTPKKSRGSPDYFVPVHEGNHIFFSLENTCEQDVIKSLTIDGESQPLDRYSEYHAYESEVVIQVENKDGTFITVSFVFIEYIALLNNNNYIEVIVSDNGQIIYEELSLWKICYILADTTVNFITNCIQQVFYGNDTGIEEDPVLLSKEPLTVLPVEEEPPCDSSSCDSSSCDSSSCDRERIRNLQHPFA